MWTADKQHAQATRSSFARNQRVISELWSNLNKGEDVYISQGSEMSVRFGNEDIIYNNNKVRI